MKKKIVCLVLAMLMVLPLLAGCKKDSSIEQINEEASRFTTTLNMWLVTESSLVAEASRVILSGLTPKVKEADLTDAQKATLAAMSEEQKAAWQQVWDISEAVNALTKSKYKVKLNLKYFTEDEYYAAVEAAFVEHEKQIAAGNVISKNDKEETVLNEHGIPELKYPTIPGYEVDVLFLGNYQKYAGYAQNKWLKDMQTHLTESALKLTSYVSSDFLNAAMYDGVLYALPNNHGVGEYVYLLADKDLMDEYNAELGDATLYDTDFREYLDWVYENKTGVYPIYSETAKIELDYAHYWSMQLDANGTPSLSPDKFSLYGDAYAGKTILGNEFLLANESYMKALATKTYYENTVGYTTNDVSARAAVKVMRGNWEDMQAYKDEYEILVMQMPVVDDDEVYNSMFAIGSYTVNEKASAEIINYINTDAEVRNILQYGIEGVNYTLEKKDGHSYAVATEENFYEMDVNKTGNVFLAHPGSEADVLRWEYEKKQNLDMVYSAVLGMTFSSQYKVDAKSMAVMEALSAQMLAAIEAMTSEDQVKALYFNAISLNHIYDKRDMLLQYVDINTVTYVEGGVTKTATPQDISAALRLMEQVPGGEADVSLTVKSPYAFYYDWCVRVGKISQGVA